MLKVANCRGKMPVLNDVKRAMLILDDISIELNETVESRKISQARDLLFSVIDSEGYMLSGSHRLIKKDA